MLISELNVGQRNGNSFVSSRGLPRQVRMLAWATGTALRFEMTRCACRVFTVQCGQRRGAGAGYVMFFVQEHPGDSTGDHAVLAVRSHLTCVRRASVRAVL